ncbi:unnamed protein product [Hymenolepis diminuta]|uniref:C2HC/C3H-type domain-containing protein n=1 Tax=Hymenolepis diminuta TaxID=6216 RepID=A0A564ZB71_HYMDI|nr:unnamed protein product [Hymenolepis diminuta]
MRHNEFIKTIRSAKAYQSAVSKGGNAPLPPPPPSAIDPDLVKCPYCNRRFNETAAERHIPFCKDKSERDRLKLQSNKTPKRPSHISADKSVDQRKTSQKINHSAQKISKSPMTTNPSSSKSSSIPNEPKDGSLPNTTRSRESAVTSIKKPKVPNTRSSSVQKLSPIHSASAHRDTKSRSRNVSARREPLAVQQTSQTRVSSKILHCHECGAKYPTTSARFCPECGVKKMAI